MWSYGGHTIQVADRAPERILESTLYTVGSQVVDVIDPLYFF